MSPNPKNPIPFFILFMTLLTIVLGLGAGFMNEILRIRVRHEKNRKGYVKLYDLWFNLYKEHIAGRAWFALNTPIKSPPGPKVTIIERESKNNGWSIRLTDKTRECYNLGSFNYLNLSETNSPTLPKVFQDIQDFGCGLCSPRSELGTTLVHQQLEESLAEFLGVEKVLTFGMGFATNSLNIPSIMDKNCLVLSDEFNHASIISGLRISGANIVSFMHNDMVDLEQKLRDGLLSGMPISKIFIIVEGVYSMHGTICNLPGLIRIKKKYGAFIYLDEAHSIGCLGSRGRGVTEYFGINPQEIDIMMATLAKSFGASGGYIGGSKRLIDHLTERSIAHLYGTSMPIPVASFIRENSNLLMTNPTIPQRVQNLCRISKYFRMSLKKMGFIVYGDDCSAVVAILIPFGILPYLTYYMKNKGICVCTVGYPATPIFEGRVRCCMNAMTSKMDIDYVLECFKAFAMKVHICPSSKARLSEEVIF